MSLRSCVMAMGLFVLLFIVNAGGSMALAQQGNETQGSTASPPMSLVPQSQQGLDRRVIDLNLEAFDAATGIPLSCGDSCPKELMDQASWVKAWSCIAKACSTEGEKRPTDCLKNLAGQVDLSQNGGDKLICNMVESPGAETRQALMKVFPAAKEVGFVEGMAFIYAFEGNVMACQKEIKDYVGPYGPAWNDRLYKDMSGCSILSKNNTREEAEKDFSSWLGGDCLKIVNTEIRKACSAPGSPLPGATVPAGK